MNLNKKNIARAMSLVLLFTTLTSVASEYHRNNIENCYPQCFNSSAGAICHIHDKNNSISAGYAQTVKEETVKVVDTDSTLVSQSESLTPSDDLYGYKNLGMAVVEGNLNIREKASTDAKVVGKMTNHAACEILAIEGDWVKISSGSAEGYVKSEYLVTGEEAKNIAVEEAKFMATVTTDTLRVRKQATTESSTLSTVSKDEDFVIVEVLDGWVKIEVDDYEGYVSSDYVTTDMKLKTGHTMKELRYGDGVSNTRIDLVNYALQFVGNRYVWGGTSLTRGIDCSGFTMRIYQKFGISLPHYSGSQPAYGKKISRSEIRPGDLIFYGNGRRINHVAIYIGNGQIVHASNKRDGIKISKAFYRKPVCIVSYLP